MVSDLSDMVVEAAKEIKFLRGELAGLDRDLDEAYQENTHLLQENERLAKRCAELMAWYDKQNGTPCEQIRHQQEVEELREENERLREDAERWRKHGPILIEALEDVVKRNEIQHWFNVDKQKEAVDAARGEG